MNAPADFIDPMGLMLGFSDPGDLCGGGVGLGPGGDEDDGELDPNPVGSCEIKLRFKLVNGSVGTVGFLHSYILTRALDGSRGWKNYYLYYGGHNELPRSEGYGRLIATGTFWGPGVPGGDFTDSYVYEIRKVIAKPCSEYDRYFSLYVERTNGDNIHYDPTGDNSNRFTYTLLDRTALLKTAFTEAEVEQKIGSLKRIPGWGKDLF